MATKLTQERVNKWNEAPLKRRLTAFHLISGAFQAGLVDPKPLWKDGKIVLSTQGGKSLKRPPSSP